MNKSNKENKAALMSAKKGIRTSIIELLRNGMEKQVFEQVIIPMKVPSGDSYVYVLVKDKSILKDGFFLPPVMPIQGGKMVSSVTRLGKTSKKTAVIMRPCETRATVELAKLGQTDLENLVLISMDCPGVLPISDFLEDPDKKLKIFDEAIKKSDDKIMRPVCQICDKSSMISGDMHIGTLGAKKDSYYLISNSEKGDEIVKKLGLKQNQDTKNWEIKAKKISEEKHKKRKNTHKKLKEDTGGLNNLIDTFSKCINCHNCMNVCPICYCRLCYFDSDKVKHPSDDYLQKAINKGSIRFLPDTTLFHMGRMMHMSISCVSCGACEDVCPVDIPVAQIFSMIADETQGLFNYISGKNIDEPLPLIVYKEEELTEMEDAK